MPIERSCRTRTNAESYVRKVDDLCSEYGVTVPGVSADGTSHDLNLTVQLRPFVEIFESGLRLATDTSLEAGVGDAAVAAHQADSESTAATNGAAAASHPATTAPATATSK